MKTSVRFLILAGLSALFAGCATVLSGTTQAVNVQALDAQTKEPVKLAHCTVTDGKGVIYAVDANPGKVTLTKGNGALNIECRAKGYVQSSMGASQSFSGTSVANILWLPGFIVDAATGAIQKYPSHVTVMMEKNTSKTVKKTTA